MLTASQFQLKAASAKTFAEKSGALAAVNANYFDENGRPLAYLKSTEKEINRSVSKHALYTGIFGISDATPFVVHRDDFQPTQATEALQTGPLLLNRGAAVEVLSGLGRYARRSVIGIDKDSRVIVAVARRGDRRAELCRIARIVQQRQVAIECYRFIESRRGRFSAALRQGR